VAHSSLCVEFDTVFDQTCFNRLAIHCYISMFGHQTMFDDVLVAKHFPFGQALNNIQMKLQLILRKISKKNSKSTRRETVELENT